MEALKQQEEFIPIDRELDELPQELRWREWMNRVEAVIFASSKIAPREMLQKVIGQSANLDMLIEDIQAELQRRSYELVPVGNGVSRGVDASNAGTVCRSHLRGC